MTRYELLERIGVGGMAEIFRGKAVAAGGFEKPVAIKRILPHLSQDKRFVELLIAEAKILSLLKHRNIVQIFDVGLGDDQQYFLVMEYVDGKDLGAVQRAFEARRRRMPFDLALHIGAEICEALEHAHTARAPDGKPMMLVHRDVSPSNVLLSRAGEIKLTDFGIAKRAEQEATGHGAVRGKFAYISPEQARNEHIDPRSDVFSVAILLWELVTNRRLFSGLGDLEALRGVRDAQVPRPLEVDPRLPPEIEPLLMAAFDRDIKRRPTAGELGAKLRSMRYSLDVTVGDPATELAKIIDTADEVQRESQQMMAQQVPPPRAAPRPAPGGASRSPQRSSGFEPEHTEATVIRIHTADAFQARDQDAGVARAREVIGRFDEEETRQAQLSGDQLRFLRSGARDSSDVAPAPLPGVAATGPRGAGAPRKRPPTDEPTTARPPMSMGDVAEPAIPDSFDLDESTVLVDRSRQAQLQAQPQVQAQPQRRSPPAAPPHMQPAPPGVMPMPTPMPGTVHNRNPLQPQPQPRGPTPGALPQTPAPFLEPHSASAGRGGASAAPMTLGGSPSVGGPPSPLQQPQGSMMMPPQGSLLPQPAMGMPPGPGQMMPPGPGQMMAPPGQPGQMMAPPGQPGQMMAPPGIPGSYGGWGAAPPPPSRGGAPDMFQQRPSMPGMGFGQKRKQVLKPWMLVVGALVMAALAFVVTRAFLS